jgi:hypothetical protein
MAIIENFKNEEGAIFNDQSQTMNVQQNVVQTVPESTEAEPEDNEQTICLSDDFVKVDFYRVIMALYHLNAFKSVKGRKATKISVFKAFGKMLGEDFKSFNNDMSSASANKNEVDIFQRLKDGLEKYENEKDEKLRKQGKPIRR